MTAEQFTAFAACLAVLVSGWSVVLQYQAKTRQLRDELYRTQLRIVESLIPIISRAYILASIESADDSPRKLPVTGGIEAYNALLAQMPAVRVLLDPSVADAYVDFVLAAVPRMTGGSALDAEDNPLPTSPARVEETYRALVSRIRSALGVGTLSTEAARLDSAAVKLTATD